MRVDGATKDQLHAHHLTRENRRIVDVLLLIYVRPTHIAAVSLPPSPLEFAHDRAAPRQCLASRTGP